jgi:hypothetical protein
MQAAAMATHAAMTAGSDLPGVTVGSQGADTAVDEDKADALATATDFAHSLQLAVERATAPALVLSHIISRQPSGVDLQNAAESLLDAVRAGVHERDVYGTGDPVYGAEAHAKAQ